MTFDITQMLLPEAFEHPVSHIDLIETHISWVILTGEFAYKIKKPVNFGFLDFSTLEKRHVYCKQELLLNSRLAPEIYLEVVGITDSQNGFSLTNKGTAIEYAVKMKQFPQSVQLDNMLTAGELSIEHMDAIAHMIADFHQTIEVADNSMNYGNPAMLQQPVVENFTQIKEHLDTALYADRLAELDQWSGADFVRLESVFVERKRAGFIRECHGDMHLRNLVWLNNKPMAFDCIEFNPDLRWIDVISEVAFLIMDLQDRNRQRFAHHFLNSYLEFTGDYNGLSVLPYYLCYRALVRAKVNVLHLKQNDLSEAERKNNIDEFESYLELAMTYTRQKKPKLILTRGLSASGKSTVSEGLLDAIGAIRIRSDVERKRLFGMASKESVAANIDGGIYSKKSSQQTYAKLIELATTMIKAGYSVIIDAAFLKHEQREPFQKLADNLAIPYILLEVTAPADILRQRITQRKNDVSDADLTVLEHQLVNWQPLHKKESKAVIHVDTSKDLDISLLVEKINKI